MYHVSYYAITIAALLGLLAMARQYVFSAIIPH